MLRTQEEIKKAVRDYLVQLPSKTKHVEEYTISRISAENGCFRFK